MPSGSRVKSVDILCSKCTIPKLYPLQNTNVYPVIMTKFLLDGGDGFEMFLVCVSL